MESRAAAILYSVTEESSSLSNSLSSNTEYEGSASVIEETPINRESKEGVSYAHQGTI